jgi:hypothetical protein
MNQAPAANAIPNVLAMSEPLHMWQKLVWELRELIDSLAMDDEPAFRAFNTAVTAWHLSDWLWQSGPEARAALKKRFKISYKETQGGIRKGLAKFQRSVREDCRALKVCREIANGSKHMRTDSPDPAIKAMASWDPVVEREGLARPADLIMGLRIADGDKEQEAVLWFIDALGYWDRLMAEEKLLEGAKPMPKEIIEGDASH